METGGERVKRVREALKVTLAVFSKALGMNLQRIADIERGRQRVPEDVLREIILRMRVDARWLLTGDGQPWLETPVASVENGLMELDFSTSAIGSCDGTVEDKTMISLREPEGGVGETSNSEDRLSELEAELIELRNRVDRQRWKEESQLFRELGLEELELRAQVGNIDDIKEILRILASSWPSPILIVDLQQQLEDRHLILGGKRLAALMATLRHQGLVVGNGHWVLSTPSSRVTARESGDTSQVARQTVVRLVRNILPQAERKDGTGLLVDALVTVSKGRGPELIAAARQALMAVCEQFSAPGSTDETVALIVGMSSGLTKEP